MDPYLWLRFAHLVGLMLISAGLIGVFIADMRSRQVRDVRLFAQAITFIAVFYDALVVPGALLLLASGTWLIAGYHGGWDFLEVPWLAGMVVLFAFEFIEGNTITRLYFVRLRRLTRQALEEGWVTPELARARDERLASFTHFLDIPILLVIVSLGVLRPDNWTQFAVASAIALAAAERRWHSTPLSRTSTHGAARSPIRPAMARHRAGPTDCVSLQLTSRHARPAAPARCASSYQPNLWASCLVSGGRSCVSTKYKCHRLCHLQMSLESGAEPLRSAAPDAPEQQAALFYRAS
jgi:hypothetical protein